MGRISEGENKILIIIIAAVTIIIIILFFVIMVYLGIKKWKKKIQEAKLIAKHENFEMQSLRA